MEKYFNKQIANHEIVTKKLSHSFALKMTIIICGSLVSSVILLGLFFGAKTPLVIGMTIFIAMILGIISSKITYSACI